MALNIVITSIDVTSDTACTIHFTASTGHANWVTKDIIETPDDGEEAWGPAQFEAYLSGLEAGTDYSVYLRGKETPFGEWQNSNVETFTTTGGPPTKAINPSPTNANSSVTLDQATITWEDGGGATSYDVYYGDTSGSLTSVSSGQAGLSFTITDITLGSPFEYVVTRYWRIDSINSAGTTTGDEWSFTTLSYAPPLPTGVSMVDGTPAGGTTGTPNGLNNMITVKRLIAAARNKIFYESL